MTDTEATPTTDALLPPSATQTTIMSDAEAISTKEAYFKALRIWLNQIHVAQQATANFPNYLAANYPHLLMMQQQQQQALFTSAAGLAVDAAAAAAGNAVGGMGGVFPLRLPNGLMRNPMRQQEQDNPARNAEIINLNGGYEYVIAPLWKRIFAEMCDIAILFVLKLMVAFMLIDIFEFNFGVDFEAMRNSMDDDYLEFLALSSEMLYAEVVTKFIVCVYEALWTCVGLDQPGGATPGKIIMGLRVLYVEAMVFLPPATGSAAAAGAQPQQPPAANAFAGNVGAMQQLRQAPLRALIYPAQNMGFQRAMIRALAKNVLMTLMFPLCFILLYYRNNRTSYDIATRTIVVETPAQRPQLRRL